MNEIIYKDLKIYHLIKRTLKHSYITIKHNDGEVIILVKTPSSSEIFVKKLIKEKESWIRKQLSKYANLKFQKITLGKEVLIFGKLHKIDDIEVKELKMMLDNISESSKIEKSYDEFYHIIAKHYMVKRVEYFATIMQLTFNDLKFKKLKSRWGSCNSNGVIVLNTQILKHKKELIEYVIVHELAHLVHMNHSKEFHNLVDRYIDDSKRKRKELKRVLLT